MTDYTPEQVAHQLELATALIDNANKQTTGRLLTANAENMCAVGCAVVATEMPTETLKSWAVMYYNGAGSLCCEDEMSFLEYFGFPAEVLIHLNEHYIPQNPSTPYVRNKTFPEIADILKEGNI